MLLSVHLTGYEQFFFHKVTAVVRLMMLLMWVVSGDEKEKRKKLVFLQQTHDTEMVSVGRCFLLWQLVLFLSSSRDFLSIIQFFQIFLENLSRFENLFSSPIAGRCGCVWVCVCVCMCVHACACMHVRVCMFYALHLENMYI